MTIRLQLALDVLEIATASRFVEATAEWVDEFEVGSPLLVMEGVRAIHELRRQCPDRPLLADTKIADSGALIAEACFAAGVNSITVLAQASQGTLQEARAVANRYHGVVWLDLIGAENPVVRAQVTAHLVDGFVVHRPPSGIPRVVVDNVLALGKPVRVAGGLTVEAVTRLGGLALDGIIVGSAILKSDDPGSMARAFRTALRELT
jgi:3-keto-L-gulonate-6-phosphate decarboxylase